MIELFTSEELLLLMELLDLVRERAKTKWLPSEAPHATVSRSAESDRLRSMSPSDQALFGVLVREKLDAKDDKNDIGPTEAGAARMMAAVSRLTAEEQAIFDQIAASCAERGLRLTWPLALD